MIVLKIWCLFLCLVLVACGGGGGGGAGNPASSAAVGTRVIAQTSATQNNKVKNYAVGDLNNDGLDDVVIGGWSGTGISYFAIMIQNADGTLTDRTTELAGGTSYSGSMHIFINDFDHDGRADIWLPGADDILPSTKSTMLWGSAGSTFGRQVFNDSMSSVGACLFDVNNDGNIDMLVRGTYQQGVNTYGYYLNHGNRTFTFVADQYVNGASACAVIRDPNNGHLAAIQAGNNQVNGFKDNISIVDAGLNLIKLIPVPQQDATMAGMIGATVADVNVDGLLDFIVMYESFTPGNPGRKEIWLNQGADNFSYAYTLDTTYNSTSDIIDFVYQGLHYYFFNGANGDATLYQLTGGNLLLYKRDSFLNMARSLGASPGVRNWSVFSAAVYRGSDGIYMLQDLNSVYYTQKL
jgi:FG-GAP-like repeat